MIKYAFIIANMLLITAGVVLGVQTFYAVTSETSETESIPLPEDPSTQTPAVTPDKPLSGYATIARRNLFNTNTTAKVESKPQVDLEALERTKLNLKLQGTVSGSKQNEYAVILDPKTRKQDLYRTGDTIQNAQVKLILREKVVLSVDGKDEILEIEKPSGKTRRAAPARLSRARASAGQSRQITRNIRLQRSVIEESMADVNELLQQARIRPYFEGGEAAGISITGIKPNSVFRKMGLRSGDVITGVEGSDIRTVDDVMRMYEQLNTASKVSLQIKRRGRDETLNYDLQ